MSEEQFDEVFEDIIGFFNTFEHSYAYLCKHSLGFILKKYIYDNKVKDYENLIKISCKAGKIVIEKTK